MRTNLSKLIQVNEHKGQKDYLVQCPACGGPHAFRDSWQYDNNHESPTVHPSLKVTTAGKPASEYCCHSFIRNGVWEFCQDSTHEMAGQKVPMIPLPDWLIEEADQK